MKRALLGLLIGCLTLAFASTAIAGQNADAGFGFHVSKTLVGKTSDVCGVDAPGNLDEDFFFQTPTADTKMPARWQTTSIVSYRINRFSPGRPRRSINSRNS